MSISGRSSDDQGTFDDQKHNGHKYVDAFDSDDDEEEFSVEDVQAKSRRGSSRRRSSDLSFMNPVDTLIIKAGVRRSHPDKVDNPTWCKRRYSDESKITHERKMSDEGSRKYKVVKAPSFGREGIIEE
ncbi:uncharacterized protein L201_007079 [Kwoniella dendrophila CBS 6074]|uniref:Uncharacterized protein n=1 Tax=Kwoniella dendrophila CBS 6074 TaxID=1295534 RepID=A0AAX4K3C8_9TREE